MYHAVIEVNSRIRNTEAIVIQNEYPTDFMNG